MGKYGMKVGHKNFACCGILELSVLSQGSSSVAPVQSTKCCTLVKASQPGKKALKLARMCIYFKRTG